MHLGRDFLFRGKQAASILWISATKLLDLPRSIDHSRPRQPFNDPCRISANHNTERFQVQCSSSRPSVWNQIETDPSILVVPVESVLFGRIMEELIDLEVIFS